MRQMQMKVEQSSGSLAFDLGTNSTNTGMLMRGIANLSHDTGGEIGNPIYIGTAAGRATTTAPGSGDFARVIGHKISGSTGIYFNPDNTTIKVA